MTGYGRALVEARGVSIGVEIRTVNHRYLDVRIRMPGGLLSLEDDVRRRIGQRLHRGRVECNVTLERTETAERTVHLDESLLQNVVAGLDRIKEVLGIDEPVRIADVANIRELWKFEPEPVDEDGAAGVLAEAVDSALAAVERMRHAEGQSLAADILPRIDSIGKLIEDVADHGPRIVAEAQQRLQERLEQLLGDHTLDPDRLAQEVAFMADRSDVSEEIARVRSHLAQFRSELTGGGPVGRTLDFLLQELNREWNTIGSKIHDASTSLVVVQARAEIEKMREQVQNIQ